MEFSAFVRTLPLGKVYSIRRYTKGQVNESYKVVTSKGKFSVRVYGRQPLREIQFTVALLRHLYGLQVPELVRLRKGFVEQFGRRYVIVYRHIPGNQLRHFTDAQLRQVGRWLATFHGRGRAFRWRKRYRFYHLPDQKIAKFARIARRAKVPYRRYLPAIIRDLKANRLRSALPCGPIHEDVKPENVLFRNGHLSGVLDFDNAYIGPFVLDLARAMAWFGTRGRKFSLPAAREVYRGYVERRRLTPLEHRELYKAIKFAFLSHVFVDYYLRAIGTRVSPKYFRWIVTRLYNAYTTFHLTPKEFSAFLEGKNLNTTDGRRG